MYKLLQANFYRLKKDVIFWLFIFMSLGISIFIVFHYADSESIVTTDKIMNEFITIQGLLLAIFIPLFIGREYSDGIIRNKIVTGHKRFNIYLSNLIISIFTGIIGELIHIVIAFTIGSFLFEKTQATLLELALMVLNNILIIAVYCTIYNGVTMLCSEITISTIGCALLLLAMFVACSGLSMTANASPYITSSYYDEQGEHIVEKQPNPNYPGDEKVKMARTIYFLLPMGQAFEISSDETTYLAQLPVYSIIVFSIINSIGVYLFQRKELK